MKATLSFLKKGHVTKKEVKKSVQSTHMLRRAKPQLHRCEAQGQVIAGQNSRYKKWHSSRLKREKMKEKRRRTVNSKYQEIGDSGYSRSYYPCHPKNKEGLETIICKWIRNSLSIVVSLTKKKRSNCTHTWDCSIVQDCKIFTASWPSNHVCSSQFSG